MPPLHRVASCLPRWMEKGRSTLAGGWDRISMAVGSSCVKGVPAMRRPSSSVTAP